MSDGSPGVSADAADGSASQSASQSAKESASGENVVDSNAAGAVAAMTGGDLVALGRTLMTELGYTTSNDILGRWMAHHIAEVMHEAEQHSIGTPERQDAEERCRRLILDLWEKRHSRPSGWPGPKAVEIVQLLEDLPNPEADWWHSQTSIGQLQELHYRILGSITDWLAASVDTSIDETWLNAFGTLLTEDESLLLSRVVGASSRSSDMTSGLSRLLRRYALDDGSQGIVDDEDVSGGAAVTDDSGDGAVEERAPVQEELKHRAGPVNRRPSPAEFRPSHTVDILEMSENALRELDLLSTTYVDVVASIASVIDDSSTQHDGDSQDGE